MTKASSAIAHAFVRRPGKNMAEGISLAKSVPDFEKALLQHRLYCEALEQAGVSVTVLKDDPLFPDGCFIGDMAVVTRNIAVIPNFGDTSPRQGEQQLTAGILSPQTFLKYIMAPGRLDAGDVQEIGGHYYIGLSDHTNASGAEQLRAHLQDYGHDVTIVDFQGETPLRLRTAVTSIGNSRVLIREEIARHFAFLSFEKIVVPQSEKAAANALYVNGTLILPAGCPQTLSQVRMLGIPVLTVDVSEFEKMNGGLSCLSILIPKNDRANVVPLDQHRGKRVA